MANEFHRLTQPATDGTYLRAAWSGTIPQAGVLNWMNNDPATPLVQAPADAAVANPGNPYVGSYFVADKEDAVDLYANRAHRALAENCDLTDQAIHRAIPVLGVQQWSGGVATFTFPATERVYGGGVGEFLRLLRRSDLSEVMDGVGAAIHVLSTTHDPLDAAGFATNVVVTFTDVPPSLLNGYYVVYGASNCVAELSELFSGGLYGMVQIPVEIQQLFLQLHAPVGSAWQQAWDAPWSTTIEELARGGLNERYARSYQADALKPGNPFTLVATVDAGWPLSDLPDTPGGGGWILRNGPAPTVVSKRELATPLATDKMNACWRTVMADDPATHGGSIGTAVQGGRSMFEDADQYGPGFAATLVHRPARMRTGGWYSDAWTIVPAGGAATVGYELIDTIVELTCELQDAGALFSKDILGVYWSAIATGMDLLEVADPADGMIKTWVIHRLVNDVKCVLRSLNGDVAPQGKANGGYVGSPTITNVTVTWHGFVTSSSDGAAERQVQQAVADGKWMPGLLPLPSPFNPGNTFMSAMPWLGTVSDYSLNEFQNFDLVVMSVFGTMPGDPINNPPNYLPDIAFQAGCRAPIVDGFGQTPPSPYFSILSNGYTFAPKLFVSALGHYNPLDPDYTIACDSGFSAPFMFTDVLTAMSGSVDGLALYPSYGNVNRYVKLTATLSRIEIAASSTQRIVVNPEQAAKGLALQGNLTYGSINPLGTRIDGFGTTVSVDINAVDVDVVFDPVVHSTIHIDAWTFANPAANLHVKMPSSGLMDPGLGVQTGDVYTACVYFASTLGGVVPRTVNVTFESNDAVLRMSSTGAVMIGYNSATDMYGMLFYNLYVGAKSGVGNYVNLYGKSEAYFQNDQS